MGRHGEIYGVPSVARPRRCCVARRRRLVRVRVSVRVRVGVGVRFRVRIS